MKDEVESKKSKEFEVSTDGVITFQERLCVPKIGDLREEILMEGHRTPCSVHPGATKIYKDLKKHYSWPRMKNDVVKHIPQWKWEDITMDFVVGLPRTKDSYDVFWVILDRLTKSAHFLPIRTTYTTDKYAEIYVKEAVRLHGVPLSIVPDRDSRFTSSF